MSIEVVVKEVVELFAGQNVWAWVNHSTAWQVFVIGWIFTTVKFVHYHFPYGMRTCWAILQVAVTTVWHFEVHGVWPKRWIRQGGGNSWVIQESLFLHHCELVVATDSKIWSTDTHNRIISDVSILFDDDSHASHFFGPVINSGIWPETFFVIMPIECYGSTMALASRQQRRKKTKSKKRRKLTLFPLCKQVKLQLTDWLI